MVDFEGETGILIIEFEEGQLSNLDISGNEKTVAPVITREFPKVMFKKDFFYEMETAISNLSSTNIFSSLNLSVKKDI